MFTKKLMEELEAPFQEQLGHLGKEGECGIKAAQVADILREAQAGRALEGCGAHEAEALKCLYASMPLSDAADYPVELFLAFARHGAFLWEKGPFAGRVPERLFAGYVLNHRVNNEDLTEHREFFYGELKDRIAGMDMRQAVREANYWCASQVTYRSTDGRTVSPMCAYRSAYGRCGEESTFTVSVLRSLGIPARQIYVPLWSHCDDNHAWAEAWCDGEWVFLGACEPEEVLNTGWFSSAATRAMVTRSRLLLPVPVPEEAGQGEAPQALDGGDMSQTLNQIGRYALTAEQEVAVCGPDGEPAQGVLVRFEVMNDARFGEVAALRTDASGRCRLRTGRGTLHVTAWQDGAYGECLVDAGKGKPCRILLENKGSMGSAPDDKPSAPDGGRPAPGIWESLTISAPRDSAMNRAVQTEEEKQRGKERLEEMNRLRREKEERFYDVALAERATAGMAPADRDRCIEIMKLACGNQREIAAFLEKPVAGAFPERWKLAVLESLREKDYRDVTAEILEENCTQAAVWEGSYEDGVLLPYILCPRVRSEMLRPFRSFLNGWLERESRRLGRNLAEEIRRDPSVALRLVRERLVSEKKAEYGDLVASAAGALETGRGSWLTQRTVCVQLLRTLGIPARLNPAEGVPEAWREGRFFPLEGQERTCRITVSGQEGVEWSYFGNWTLARFAEDGYRTLALGWRGGQTGGPFSVVAGDYRVLTANRLPNGDILAKQMFFHLAEGEEREIRLELAEADPAHMLASYELTDFALRREDGAECLISGLVRERPGLFIWMGEDEEPTEHILNEIFERKEAFAGLQAGLHLVATRPEIKGNPAFRRVRESLPEAELLYDDFGADMEALARRMYLEPGVLPLVVAVDPSMRGIYGVAGYNVGTGDMLLKLLSIVGQEM